MSKYNWKEKYNNPFRGIDNSETDIDTRFYSVLGTKEGDGSRENPILSSGTSAKFPNNASSAIILGNGYNVLNSHNTSNKGTYNYILGQDRYNTVYSGTFTSSNDSICKYFYNLRTDNLSFRPGYNTRISFINCYIQKDVEILQGACSVDNIQYSIIRFNFNGKNYYESVANSNHHNCFLEVTDIKLIATFIRGLNYGLFKDCDIIISEQADLNTYRNNYYGFDNCRFKIGEEKNYSLLQPVNEEGNTVPNPGESDYRNEFVRRCELQGFTMNNITTYGETLPQGHWVFDNNSCVESYIKSDSILDCFQKRYFITLGCNEETIEDIPVTTVPSTPASLNPSNPQGDFLIYNGDHLYLDPSMSITDRHETYIESNIIWLGGKRKLSAIDIIHNLPVEYGVFTDNTPSLSENPVTVIEAGKNYLVRSSDKKFASVSYNDAVYSTHLAKRDNVFRGVEGQNSFEILSGNPAIYEVTDHVLHKIIQIRIVEDIPSEKIISGNLQNGYWYLVTPDNLNDTTGTVTYNGKQYPCFSSFLVKDTFTFSINGSCHLRRCWSQEYSVNDAQDKAFWQNRQKPLWTDVIPNDLRCLMKGDSAYTVEMKMDTEGNYIASGHPDFYKLLTGEAGLLLPSFDITGAFMQIRLFITTLNPV